MPVTREQAKREVKAIATELNKKLQNGGYTIYPNDLLNRLEFVRQFLEQED